ncbi:hypothetical protein [Streptomyces mexicanus]|uniref:hypothetical protein n=1 Tax=Streptomyces mexicanus TaxID=178566 RepID=UPI00364ABD2A
MARGDTTDNAAKLLHELHEYHLEHPVTGPVEGHSRTATAAAPLSLGTLDHINGSVREVIDHTLETNPAAGPLPQRVQDVYAWMHEQMQHADEVNQQRAAVIEYRQYLEHNIRIGNVKVIRPHRCPKCRTFGLMWRHEAQRALCTNLECVDRDGISTIVSLAQLAHQHVTAQESKKSSVG